MPPDSPPVVPRRFTPPFSLDIPRHWLPGDPLVSSFLNAYTVLVPANEAFFIRTLKACMPRIHDAGLRDACAEFLQQEAQHGVAHKRYWRNLDAQGYRFRGFERRVDVLVYRLVERCSPLPLRASLVSCVEHINALIGHEFLAQRMLSGAHPQVQALMEWHFAEEIEHKHVAFDVLQAIAPAYWLRVLGFVLAAPLFYLLVGLGAAGLLAQDGLLARSATRRQAWRHFGPGQHMLGRTLAHLRDYLRPGFHPSALDDQGLARAVLDALGSADPPLVVPTARSARGPRSATSACDPAG